MTLDEAIEHCDEAVVKLTEKGCIGCAEDHEQLATWLKELRELRKINENRQK